MICIPIVAKTSDSAIRKMARAHALADVIEIRLDLMEEFDLKEIMGSATGPVMVTYRSRREGGTGTVGDETRVRYLQDAMEAGADYVDVEFRMPIEHQRLMVRTKGLCKIVMSAHLLDGTPSREDLERVFMKMAATGADIVKIVTWAREWEDNFRVLELIPRARAAGTKIIAFCMGPLGRISRVLCPLMGGHMTFAALDSGEESASGQLSVDQMKMMWELVSL